MVDLSHNPYGCYLVYDKNNPNGVRKDYLNKVEALIEASRLKKLNVNAGVSFKYYSSVWEKIDFSLCGKIPLKTLYRERALQLRDKYDYLVLKYSGGSDSHNILHTFLKNNIKIDALSVNWPLAAKRHNMYNVNSVNKDPRNELSEWDYTLKPDLEWISKNRPEIKIYIDDWFQDLMTLQRVDDLQLTTQNHYVSPVSYYRMRHWPRYQKELFDKGINVGVIEGVDKPAIYLSENVPNKVVMRFIDWPLQHNVTYGGTGVEYFYWTADMPMLPIEMAYQMFLHFKVTRKDRWMLYNMSTFSNLKDKKFLKRLAESTPNFKTDLYKKILYPYWDFSRFQAEKDLGAGAQLKPGKPQDWVFWEHPESSAIQDKWRHHISSYFNEVSSDFLAYNKHKDVTSFKPTYSFPIGGDWFLD